MRVLKFLFYCFIIGVGAYVIRLLGISKSSTWYDLPGIACIAWGSIQIYKQGENNS